MNPNEGINDTESGELDHDNTYDKEGWQYAPEFGARFSGTAKLTDFVRRRKWVRTCIKNEQQTNSTENAQLKEYNSEP